jgi:hypothetical protein
MASRPRVSFSLCNCDAGILQSYNKGKRSRGIGYPGNLAEGAGRDRDLPASTEPGIGYPPTVTGTINAYATQWYESQRSRGLVPR